MDAAIVCFCLAKFFLWSFPTCFTAGPVRLPRSSRTRTDTRFQPDPELVFYSGTVTRYCWQTPGFRKLSWASRGRAKFRASLALCGIWKRMWGPPQSTFLLMAETWTESNAHHSFYCHVAATHLLVVHLYTRRGRSHSNTDNTRVCMQCMYDYVCMCVCMYVCVCVYVFTCILASSCRFLSYPSLQWSIFCLVILCYIISF